MEEDDWDQQGLPLALTMISICRAGLQNNLKEKHLLCICKSEAESLSETQHCSSNPTTNIVSVAYTVDTDSRG